MPPFECALPRATTSGRTGDAKAALGKRATLPARGVVERRTLCSGTAEEAEAPVASLTLETGEVGTGPDEPPPPLVVSWRPVVKTVATVFNAPPAEPAAACVTGAVVAVRAVVTGAAVSVMVLTAGATASVTVFVTGEATFVTVLVTGAAVSVTVFVTEPVVLLTVWVTGAAVTVAALVTEPVVLLTVWVTGAVVVVAAVVVFAAVLVTAGVIDVVAGAAGAETVETVGAGAAGVDAPVTGAAVAAVEVAVLAVWPSGVVDSSARATPAKRPAAASAPTTISSRMENLVARVNTSLLFRVETRN